MSEKAEERKGAIDEHRRLDVHRDVCRPDIHSGQPGHRLEARRTGRCQS